MELSCNIINEFSRLAHLPINVNKTRYARNSIAETNNSHAQPHLLNKNGQPQMVDAIPSTQAFRILGVHFDMTGSFEAQKNLTLVALSRNLPLLAKRAVNPLQLVHVINAMLLSAASYPMLIAAYTSEELDILDKQVAKTVQSKLRVYSGDLSKWMHLPHRYNGLGLNSLKTLHACQQASTLQMILVGPKCPAQQLIQHCIAQTRDNTSQIPYTSAFSPIETHTRALRRFNVELHTTEKPTITPLFLATLLTEKHSRTLHTLNIQALPHLLAKCLIKHENNEPVFKSDAELAATNFSPILIDHNTPLLPSQIQALAHLLKKVDQQDKRTAAKALKRWKILDLTTIPDTLRRIPHMTPKATYKGEDLYVVGLDGTRQEHNGRTLAAGVVSFKPPTAREHNPDYVNHGESIQPSHAIIIPTTGSQTSRRAELQVTAEFKLECATKPFLPSTITPFLKSRHGQQKPTNSNLQLLIAISSKQSTISFITPLTHHTSCTFTHIKTNSRTTNEKHEFKHKENSTG